MKNIKGSAFLLLVSLVLLAGCFNDEVIVYEKENADEMVTIITMRFRSVEQCYSKDGCAIFLDFSGINQSALLVNDFVADNPQAGTARYGVMIEEGLAGNGIYLNRYFDASKESNIGLKLSPLFN